MRHSCFVGWLGVCLLLCLSSLAEGRATTRSTSVLHRLRLKDAKALHGFLRDRASFLPLISAHRGGPAPGFPENAIETFTHTLRRFYATIECDVVPSKDGVLVLMHDDTLSRTTNGKGQVSSHTWAALQRLRLKDPQGRLTPYKIPTFRQTLRWAKGKTILSVDVKLPHGSWRSKILLPAVKERFRQVVKMIQQERAHDRVMVITYTLQQARFVHSLDAQLMLSVGMGSARWMKRHLKSLPAKRMVAFTGVLRVNRAPKRRLYKALKQQKILPIAGLFRVERKLKRAFPRAAKKLLPLLYQAYIWNGVSIFATDEPALVARALRPIYQAASQPKAPGYRFFRRYFAKK